MLNKTAGDALPRTPWKKDLLPQQVGVLWQREGGGGRISGTSFQPATGGVSTEPSGPMSDPFNE